MRPARIFHSRSRTARRRRPAWPRPAVVVQAEDRAARCAPPRPPRAAPAGARPHTGSSIAQRRRAAAPAARAAPRERRLHPRLTRAHHQHLRLARDLVVALGVGPIGRHAQARHAPDRRLEAVPVRPHEGLVVEARRQQRREARAQRREVEIEARPGVAGGRPPGPSCAARSVARVLGVRAPPSADVQQAGGLFDTAAEDAARPVQLEAAAHVHDALRQQRRGHRVTGEALHLAAVELEAQRPCAVDPGTLRCRQAVAAHPASAGRPLGDAVHRLDLVRDRVAQHVEPQAAAEGVAPALGVFALGVVAEVQVGAPGLVAAVQRWPRDAGGAAAVELVLRARAAQGAGQLHHRAGLNEQFPLRRLRRPAGRCGSGSAGTVRPVHGCGRWPARGPRSSRPPGWP
jgi:hypothetical protein